MAHKIPKIRTEKKEWKIYVIMFPPRKDFYIGISSQKELYYTLKDHCRSKIERTSKYINEYVEEGNVPQMFLLCCSEEVKTEAFSRSVAWAKSLIDNGYYCINGDTFVEYTEDLYGKAKLVYDEIKNVNLTELLSSNRSLYPNYKPGRKQSREKNKLVVNLRFTPEDYDIIEKRAKECDLPISAFLYNMALSGAVVGFGNPVTNEYLKEVRVCNQRIQETLLTIYYLRQYFPYDLERIDNAKNTIEKHYKLLLKLSNKYYKELDKFYKKMKKL